MKKSYLFVLLLFFCFGVYGQNPPNQELPNPIPPSPSAFKFATYGNIPLNGSTGGFNYSIPLFSLSEGDIKINTSVDYYSNGVNIDAMSSTVGMSWNLNAGGVISRVVRDEPDENASERWYPLSIDPNLDHNNIRRGAEYGSGFGFDTEPDWFSFNVNGISGSFYFDKDLNIKMNSSNKIKINFDKQNSKFEIIDDNGYKYIFGGNEFVEVNLSLNDCSHLSRLGYNSSWFLSEIISPNNNRIDFSYQNTNYRYVTSISNSITFDEKCICGNFLGIYYDSHTSKCVSYNQIQSLVLSEISSSNGKIIFKYIESNSNVLGGENLLLDKVILNHKDLPIEKFKFDYKETIASLNHTDEKLQEDNSLKTRFFLTKVTKTTPDDLKKINPYYFEYYDEELLPCRLSYNKDMFGFFNNSNNRTPFSYPKEDKAYSLAKSDIGFVGANKEVNPQTVFYGMLKKIAYPTGGSTLIEYEANKDIGLFSDVTNTNKKEKIILNKGCDSGLTTSGSFIFVSDGSPINYTVNATVDTHICGGESDTTHDKYLVSIKDLTTGESIRNFSRGAGIPMSTDSNLDCEKFNLYTPDINRPLCTIPGHEYEVSFTISSLLNQISGTIEFEYGSNNVDIRSEKDEILLSKDCNSQNVQDSFTFISNGSPINYSVESSIYPQFCDRDGISHVDYSGDNYSVTIKDLTTGETIRSFTRDADIYIYTRPYLNYCDNSNINRPVCTIADHEYIITFELNSLFSQMIGAMKFEYNVDIELVEKTIYGGGARVKNIVDRSENDDYNNRNFYYNKLEEYPSDFTSLNKILEPKYSQHFSYFKNCLSECCSSAEGFVERLICAGKTIYYNLRYKNRFFISSNSLNSLYNNRKQTVYYSAITEFFEGNDKKNGAIEKVFTPVYDKPPTVINTPEIPNIPYSNVSDIHYGELSEMNFFKSIGDSLKMIKKESYFYDKMEYNFIRSSVFSKSYEITDVMVQENFVDNYSISQYDNYFGKKRLISKKETLYYPQEIINDEKYEYSSAPYYNLAIKKSVNSKGDTLVTKYEYPQNIDANDRTPAEQDLINQHRVATPIQTETINNGQKIKQRTLYNQKWPNLIVPEFIQTLKGEYDPSTNNLENRITYHDYDNKGNPIEVSKTNGTRIVYIWGYQQSKPIAKIENAKQIDFTTNQNNKISAVVSASDSDNNETTENSLRTKLEELRVAFPESIVTTYTYDPLIGVTSITDPRGYTIYYQYDEFNRLKQVKDDKGHIVSKNEYHYKN